MVTKWDIASLKAMYEKIICISKVEFPQARGFWSMEMWGSVPVKNSIVPDICLQIGLGNYDLSNLPYFVGSDVERLSTGGKVTHHILVTVYQLIAKMRHDCQIWYINGGFVLA